MLYKMKARFYLRGWLDTQVLSPPASSLVVPVFTPGTRMVAYFRFRLAAVEHDVAVYLPDEEAMERADWPDWTSTQSDSP